MIPEPCLSLSFHTRRHCVCLAFSPWTSPSQLRGQRERMLQTAVTWRWSDASKEGKTFLRPRFRNQHKHANKFVRHNMLFYDPHSVQHALLWYVSGLMLSLFSLCVVIAFMCSNKQRSGSVKLMSRKKKCVLSSPFLKLYNVNSIHSRKLF